MKTQLTCFLITALFLVSCSKDNMDDSINRKWQEIETKYLQQPICNAESDGFTYPQSWTAEDAHNFEIPDETIAAMSTCGLIDTYINHPATRRGPWCTHCSYFSSGVFLFNHQLKNHKEISELFVRDDCVGRIIERYAKMIEDKPYLNEWSFKWECFEMMIANDSFISKLNNSEKDILMVMALKQSEIRKKHDLSYRESKHIMTGIMMADGYTPFMEEVENSNGLEQWTQGYSICARDGVVEKYAKKYLNR